MSTIYLIITPCVFLSPGLSLRHSGPQGADDGQEPVTRDGGEGHHAGHHAQHWHHHGHHQAHYHGHGVTCVEHPDLAEDGGQDVPVMVAELPHQTLRRAPERNHQVGHGQVHQVVIHRGPACQVDHKDKDFVHFVKESVWDEEGFKTVYFGRVAGWLETRESLPIIRRSSCISLSYLAR